MEKSNIFISKFIQFTFYTIKSMKDQRPKSQRNTNLIFDVTMSKPNFFSIWKMKWCFMKVFCLFEKKNLYIRFALVWTQSNICCGQHFVVKLLFAANGIAMQKGHVKERKGRFGCFFVFIKMKKMTLEKFWVS